MTIIHHPDVEQGSEEWAAMRCGLLTASEMHLILTPTLKAAANEKERAHLFELLAQRINQYVEPRYIGDDMLRGINDEELARDLYSGHFEPIEKCGFITNDELGFKVGFSPDGLVGTDGFIEIKSRRQKFQVETLINRAMPLDFALQVQTGLWVSGRKWCDYLSYCGGMHMPAIRIYPDDKVIAAIKDAARGFETRLQQKWADYSATIASELRMVPTERVIEQEMIV